MVLGFLYLVVAMDWYSRDVLAWRLSNTMDTSFCLDALEDAVRMGRPKIFNTDQAARFTSAAFADRLEAAGEQISMDLGGSSEPYRFAAAFLDDAGAHNPTGQQP